MQALNSSSWAKDSKNKSRLSNYKISCADHGRNLVNRIRRKESFRERRMNNTFCSGKMTDGGMWYKCNRRTKVVSK